eukprot:TRINITY_DN2570_c0_g1_i2.p1 TRINITY_DN2570_c0_g1~~TRINITY_DN2570_c0_g1_i2.p1  ORF type:complete len:240 (+),score=47.16 TRINITY_DN2570_c0_g1_i2:63-722(+)
MVELKGMVKKALEKKGVLNRIRAELRASLFEVIEEQDQQQQAGSDAAEQGQGTVRGCCTEQARQMHETKSGQLLTALLCEYFEWADLSHTLKVYLPEANLLPVYPRRAKLEEELGLSGSSSSSVVSGSHQPPRPLIFDVLQTFLASKVSQLPCFSFFIPDSLVQNLSLHLFLSPLRLPGRSINHIFKGEFWSIIWWGGDSKQLRDVTCAWGCSQCQPYR